MADYTARANELLTKYAEAYRAAQEQETRGGPPVVHASWINLRLGLERYIDWRDRAINDGIPLLKPDSGATAVSAQERWGAHYQSKGSEAYTQIDNLGRSVEDAIAQFIFFVSTQESLFFKQLSEFSFARAAGDIRARIRELQTEAESLEGKWRDLVGLDERIDGEIATLRANFIRELEAAVADLLGWSRKAEQAARTAVGVAAEYDDKADPEPSFGPIVVEGMSVAARVQAPFDMFVREAQRMYDNEAPVHNLFQNLRERVGEYYEKNYLVAGAAFSSASTESADRAGRCPTDGQREDAKRFLEKCAKEIEPALAEFRSAFDKFYDQFKGRFLDTVSDQTAELLADQEFFNKFWREFEGERVPEAFQQVLTDIERNFGVSFDTLTPETREKVREYFKEKLKPHQEALRKMDSGFFRRLYEQTQIGVKLSFDKIKSMHGFRK